MARPARKIDRLLLMDLSFCSRLGNRHQSFRSTFQHIIFKFKSLLYISSLAGHTDWGRRRHYQWRFCRNQPHSNSARRTIDHRRWTIPEKFCDMKRKAFDVESLSCCHHANRRSIVSMWFLQRVDKGQIIACGLNATGNRSAMDRIYAEAIFPRSTMSH